MNPEPTEDMERLRRVLHDATGLDPSFLSHLNEPGEPLQILDLACGACDEAGTLTRFFAGLRRGNQTPASVHLTGIDIREREIGWARERFTDHEDTATGVPIGFEFLCGDGRELGSHRELPGQFDVIFMRHQNLWNGQRTWEEIYHQALGKLSPDGRLVITSYFDREHDQALGAIAGQGGELVTSVRNEASRQLSTPGKSVDRHVAILRRRA